MTSSRCGPGEACRRGMLPWGVVLIAEQEDLHLSFVPGARAGPAVKRTHRIPAVSHRFIIDIPRRRAALVPSALVGCLGEGRSLSFRLA